MELTPERATIDVVMDPVVVLRAERDGEGRIIGFVCTDANPAACRYSRRSRDELVGGRMLELFPGLAGAGQFESSVQVVETGLPLSFDDVVYDSEAEGEQRRYDLRGARIGPDLLVMTWRDVTDRWRAHQALEQRARTDALTGLLNRSAVMSRLSEIASYQLRTGTLTAVLFCDIDRFKAINDEFGHATGDVVLQELGQRIRSTIRSNDVAARIGGDELLIVLTGVRDLDDAVAVAGKIRESAAKPVVSDGAVIHTGLSIGVALFQPGESVEEVVARADAAMYAAKRSEDADGEGR